MPWWSAPVVVWAGLFFCCAIPVWAGDAASDERAWIERAGALVAAAKDHAEAAGFQRNVLANRERLRGIVRRAGPEPIPGRRQLHASMVLLDALLKSASDCQQAGHVVCEANLIRRLDAQLEAARAQLKAVES
jgi:hypothetical protein